MDAQAAKLAIQTPQACIFAMWMVAQMPLLTVTITVTIGCVRTCRPRCALTAFVCARVGKKLAFIDNQALDQLYDLLKQACDLMDQCGQPGAFKPKPRSLEPSPKASAI